MNSMNFDMKLSEIRYKIKKGISSVYDVNHSESSINSDLLVYDEYDNANQILKGIPVSQGDKWNTKWKYTYPLVRNWHGRNPIDYYTDEDFSYNLIVVTDSPNYVGTSKENIQVTKYISIVSRSEREFGLDDVYEIRIDEKGKTEYRTKRHDIIDNHKSFCDKINTDSSGRITIKELPELDNRYGYRGFMVSFSDDDYDDIPILTNIKSWWRCDEISYVSYHDFSDLIFAIIEKLCHKTDYRVPDAFLKTLAFDTMKESIDFKKAVELFETSPDCINNYNIAESLSHILKPYYNSNPEDITGEIPTTTVFTKKYFAIFPRDYEFDNLKKHFDSIYCERNGSYMVRSRKYDEDDWDYDLRWIVEDGKVFECFYDDDKDETVKKCCFDSSCPFRE